MQPVENHVHITSQRSSSYYVTFNSIDQPGVFSLQFSIQLRETNLKEMDIVSSSSPAVV
jgi:hypothetical protein